MSLYCLSTMLVKGTPGLAKAAYATRALLVSSFGHRMPTGAIQHLVKQCRDGQELWAPACTLNT